MTEWRWDQGRVSYFQFDVLKEVAKVLVKFEGKNVNDDAISHEFDASLRNSVGMPFKAPENYTVNRNYSRVFQCALLARHERGSLFVSDICKQLATEGSALSNSDDYLYEVVKRFRFPFPAFQEYDATSLRIYPFCAVIKYLIALKEKGEEPKVSIEDVCSYVIGNACTGLEDVEFYKHLSPTGHMAKDKTVRQLREMLAFISQLSFLKAFDKNLYLDVNGENDVLFIIDHVLKPIDCTPMADKTEEFCQLTKVAQHIATSGTMTAKRLAFIPQNIFDLEFAEGNKVRVQHLRAERSTLLRKFYISVHPEPVCAACKMHIQQKYPWVGYMLDLHHLLPLASAVQISEKGTSLNDLVGLCPSCHRAIHAYYKKWLKASGQEDFRSKQEAMSVYLEAVKEIA